MFVLDCNLAESKSKFCKPADLDRLFVAVDGLTGGKKRDKALERAEFLQCLVRMAVLKYVQPKIMQDVSEAYERLLVEDIEPRLNPAMFAHPNAFRELCYTQSVEEVLKRHEESLRSLFSAIARVGRTPATKPLGPMLTLGEWKTLCKRLMLFDIDLTDRDCNMCFVNSRMAVIDGQSERGKPKEAAIPFEGFCECLCRVACLKALPTAEEMAASSTPEEPCPDAGLFFLNMHDPKLVTLFREANAVPWGGTPRMPIAECVQGLLSMILRTIETTVSSEKGGKGFLSDLKITAEEMQSWCELVGWERKEEKMNTSLD